MNSGKTEIPVADSQSKKKRRRKKLLCWLAVDLSVAAIILGLLLYKPGRYQPEELADSDYDPKEVSPYLTHELMPQLYNGAQFGEPFEVTITQKGINEMVTRSDWPLESEGVMFYAPAVLFESDCIVFMGTADIKGVQFVITIELKPKVNEEKMLNLEISKVKVGAMNVTPLAKMMAKKMYSERLSEGSIDTEDLRTKIAASLLNEEPFEPVFKVEDKKVRLKKISVKQGMIILDMVPVTERRHKSQEARKAYEASA